MVLAGLGEVLAQTFDEAHGLVAFGVVQDDGELVAADARDEVALAHRAREGETEVAQYTVADVVAQAIVDDLNSFRSMSTRVKAQPYRAERTGELVKAMSKVRRLAIVVNASCAAVKRARCRASASWHAVRTASSSIWGTTSGSQ